MNLLDSLHLSHKFCVPHEFNHSSTSHSQEKHWHFSFSGTFSPIYILSKATIIHPDRFPTA